VRVPKDRRSFSLKLDRHKAKLTLLDRGTALYELAVDGIPQSIVSLSDPRRLEYPYVRHIARVIDAAAPAGSPLRSVHLGAGALTLPRYVQATRPGSPQIVVEFEPALYDAVVTTLPLPEGSAVRVLFGDARQLADEPLPSDPGAGNAVESGFESGWVDAEFTVVDLWDAAVIRRHVASLEFYRRVAARSAAGGVVAVNLFDGSPFDYARRQAATLRLVFEHVAVVIDFDPDDHDGPLGNVLVLASDRSLSVVTHPQLLGAPHPHVLHGDHLTSWIDDASAMTDADGTDSPDPDDPKWDD
jgi:hypothetical protein